MFVEAKPIWAKGKTKEKNTFVAFRAQVAADGRAELHLAGTAFYRVFVNGEFLCFGPARAAGGYVREDIVELPDDFREGDVVIEAAGYYCKSFSTVLAPSFLMAEIRRGDRVLAATGRDMKAYLPGCRIRRTERYSAQRYFTEIWDYTGNKGDLTPECETQTEAPEDLPKILDRGAPYPRYEAVELTEVCSRGSFWFREDLPYRKQRYSWEMTADWGFFEWDEIEHHPFSWAQRLVQKVESRKDAFPVFLREGEYALLDFGRVEAGFFRAFLHVLEDSDVVISFCEYFEGETFAFQNMNVHNVAEIFLEKGDARRVQSFEPYSFRFVMLAVKKGAVRLDAFGMVTYMFDVSRIQMPKDMEPEYAGIYQAAVRTFAHNAVDIYTDCPSRERAGYLCDSYFTAKAEYALTGETKVEDVFLENYRLYENHGELPEGMLPKCYPSDPLSHQSYIPQWPMWYILEAEEYILKRGHEDKKEEFRKSIYGLLGFYRRYENEDGLLERLPSWNFVEWSTANKWTQDVNYPTNFLYAQALECVGHLYGDADCAAKCKKIRETAVRQSLKDGYFRDHAVRDEDGRLCLLEDSSEACQYYAVLFGGLDMEEASFRKLKRLILAEFSPERETMPQILPVNMFIGAYLRIETLLRMKEYSLVLHDIKAFFGNMERDTQTLWENRQHKGSYDHGFASYALAAIREALALRR